MHSCRKKVTGLNHRKNKTICPDLPFSLSMTDKEINKPQEEIKQSKGYIIRRLQNTIKPIFNKYLLLENTRIRFVEKISPIDLYIFENPNRRKYIIRCDQFKDLFKGPMINLSFNQKDLEVGTIFTVKNNQIGCNLLEYKKKLISKETYRFEDMNGFTISINPDDIYCTIIPDSMEDTILLSGNYFDV